MVNKSIYHAFECKIELFAMEPIHHTGAKSNVVIKPIVLRTSNLTILPRNRKTYNATKDPFSLFAHTFFTEEDITPLLSNGNSYLELPVTGRHGLTGLADTFIIQYANETVIKENHKFDFGNKLDTISVNQSV